MLLQPTPASSSGTPTRPSPVQLKSCTGTSTAWSSTSASKPKSPSPLSPARDSAQVSPQPRLLAYFHITNPYAAYTISRAILSDAIALTRGDRFFTADYTPFNMTSWGFTDCQRDPDGPGNGSMLGRLLLRALPEHYTSDSTYTWFPLMTPHAMQAVFTKLGDTGLYSCARPGGPQPVQVLGTYADARQVLKDEKSFATGFADRAGRLVRAPGCVYFRPASWPRLLTIRYEGSSSRRPTPRGPRATSVRCSTCSSEARAARARSAASSSRRRASSSCASRTLRSRPLSGASTSCGTSSKRCRFTGCASWCVNLCYPSRAYILNAVV